MTDEIKKIVANLTPEQQAEIIKLAEAEKLKSPIVWHCGCQDSKEKPRQGIYQGEQEYHYNFECPACKMWFCVQKKEK